MGCSYRGATGCMRCRNAPSSIGGSFTGLAKYCRFFKNVKIGKPHLQNWWKLIFLLNNFHNESDFGFPKNHYSYINPLEAWDFFGEQFDKYSYNRMVIAIMGAVPTPFIKPRHVNPAMREDLAGEGTDVDGTWAWVCLSAGKAARVRVLTSTKSKERNPVHIPWQGEPRKCPAYPLCILGSEWLVGTRLSVGNKASSPYVLRSLHNSVTTLVLIIPLKGVQNMLIKPNSFHCFQYEK